MFIRHCFVRSRRPRRWRPKAFARHGGQAQVGSRRDTRVLEPGSFSGARRGCLFLQLLEQRLEASVPA